MAILNQLLRQRWGYNFAIEQSHSRRRYV